MGFRNNRKYETLPETAMVKDNLGLWPVDMEMAFDLYRKRKWIYHGAHTMADSVVHMFVNPDTDKCE